MTSSFLNEDGTPVDFVGRIVQCPYGVEDPETSDRRALIVNRVNTAIVAFAVVLVFQFGGMIAMYLQVHQLQGTTVFLQGTVNELEEETLINRSNGLRSRAVNCQILLSLGETLPSQCLEPSVVALYDPEAPPTAGANSEGQRLNRELLCGLYVNQSLPAPAICEGSPTP